MAAGDGGIIGKDPNPYGAPNPNNPAGPPGAASEDWWRSYSGTKAPGFDPNDPYAKFDASSVYDPNLAEIDRKIAAVKAGTATWSLDNLQKLRDQYTQTPGYQQKVADAKLQSTSDYDAWLGKRFSDVATSDATQNRSNDIYNSLAGEINAGETSQQQALDRALTGQQSQIAGTMSRRGMSGSGYATAAQGGAVSNTEAQRQSVIRQAAAERQSARENALREAVAEGEKSVMGEAQIHGMGTPLEQQLAGQAEQEYMQSQQLAEAERIAQMQNDSSFWGNLMKTGTTLAGAGIGALAGGPMGAAAGGQAGSLLLSGGSGAGPSTAIQAAAPLRYQYYDTAG